MYIAYSKLASEIGEAKPKLDIKRNPGKSAAADNNQAPATDKKAPIKKTAEKSIYIIAMEQKFKKSALKKYELRIKEIQKYFPNWEPIL